jgi:hypothetical protein
VLAGQFGAHRGDLAGGSASRGLGGFDPLAGDPLLTLLGGGRLVGLLGGDELGDLVGPAVGPVEPQPAHPTCQLLVDDGGDALAELVVAVDRPPHRPERRAGQLLEPQVRLQRRRAGHGRAHAGPGDGHREGDLDRGPQRLVRDRRLAQRRTSPSAAASTSTAPEGPHHRHVTPSTVSPSSSTSSTDSSPPVV